MIRQHPVRVSVQDHRGKRMLRGRNHMADGALLNGLFADGTLSRQRRGHGEAASREDGRGRRVR